MARHGMFFLLEIAFSEKTLLTLEQAPGCRVSNVKAAVAPMRQNGKKLLVGQIARLAGVKSDTLRFYERAGLMPQTERTAGGYRAYRPDAVERLHFIRKAQALGFSLDQVKRILRLRQSGSLPCDYVI